MMNLWKSNYKVIIQQFKLFNIGNIYKNAKDF